MIVGYGFMQHGFAKLFRGADTFAAILHGMGVPAPHLMAWLTIFTELLGGFAVLLGAFVTIVSVPIAAVLLVALFKVHLRYGFSSIKLLALTATGAKFGPVGYEVILLYIACLAALVIGGSGPFAIDGLFRERFEARTRTSGSLQPLRGNESLDSVVGNPGLNSVIARIAALSPVVFRFVRHVTDPRDGFDVFQTEFDRSDQGQGRPVFNRQRLPVKVSRQ
jgi:putative oxidoreductase